MTDPLTGRREAPWRIAVVDTNVVVSGMISGSAGGPPQRVLDAMLEGTLRFVLSVDLLAEYRCVLLRPFAAAKHGLSETEIDEVLESLAMMAIEAPKPAMYGELPPGIDSSDAHVAKLVLGLPGAALITGDRALGEALAGHCPVVSPAEAVRLLAL
jgi:predicted nucleic acid-binding protein